MSDFAVVRVFSLYLEKRKKKINSITNMYDKNLKYTDILHVLLSLN